MFFLLIYCQKVIEYKFLVILVVFFLSFSSSFFFFICHTGVWTQCLHFEPLCQPCFVLDFFQYRVKQTICTGWLWTTILLITASWVARIIAVSHQHPALMVLLFIYVYFLFINESVLWKIMHLKWPIIFMNRRSKLWLQVFCIKSHDGLYRVLA
jgi:hypothetical protein